MCRLKRSELLGRSGLLLKENSLEMEVGRGRGVLAYIRNTFLLNALLGRLLRGLGGETGENTHQVVPIRHLRSCARDGAWARRGLFGYGD